MKLSDDTSICYYARINDLKCGPYSMEGLESLVYLQKIAPENLICREGTEVFSPIETSELRYVLFPQIFQKKDIPGHWPPPKPRQMPIPARPNRKHYRLTEAKFEKLNDDSSDSPNIAVVDILKNIREKEIESGRDHVRRRRFRFSRRSMDFWITVIAGNSLFLGGAFFMKNTASIVFGIAGSGLFTFGLLWTMFGIMDDY